MVLEKSEKPEPWALACCSLLGAVRGAFASPVLVGWPPFSPGFSPSRPSLSHSSSPLCMAGSKVPYFFFFFWNRETFITGPYKEVDGSCLKNPKITESFPPSLFRGKVRMRRGYAESHSRVWLFVIPWTVARQAPPSMGFSRQEYWSGLPFPSPGDLPNPGIKPGSPACRRILFHLSQTSWCQIFFFFSHLSLSWWTYLHGSKWWGDTPGPR